MRELCTTILSVHDVSLTLSVYEGDLSAVYGTVTAGVHIEESRRAISHEQPAEPQPQIRRQQTDQQHSAAMGDRRCVALCAQQSCALN